MPSLNIHRNDTVKVLTGSDRGKTGRVLRVFPDKGTVLVEHVRVVKKTVSSKQGQRTKGGIAEQESPINVSNVMLVCPNCGRCAWATRLKATQGADLQEVRADAADEEVVRQLQLSFSFVSAK
jgi:large subunit ribosomal protein L24